MRQIFVLAEHRQGQIRDITFEMLTKGREMAEKANASLSALLLGQDVDNHSKALSDYADKVFLVEDPMLEHFTSEVYHKALSKLITDHKPLLTLVGHTSFGLELAPRLAAALGLPLATDCIELGFENEQLVVTRQMYGGKVNVKGALRKSEGYIVTIRQATFPAKEAPARNGEIIQTAPLLPEGPLKKQFIEYVLPPPGGVDITAADVLVGIGRGIKDSSEIPQVEALAGTLGGALACSRPIVDKGWLPNDRQVGSSGKTVKPKLYIALGISGAFQHVLGMKNADLIIAVNKDPRAPIFSVADYGVVGDLFKIVPALKGRLEELRGTP